MSMPSTVSAVAVASTEGGPAQHRWEDSVEATWDSAVQEDEEGNIISSATESAAQAIRRRRKRLEQTDYSQKRKRVVRDMIRYVFVVIDASRWMRTKDPVLPPGTRLDVTINMLIDFIQEFFDQNPLSHLGFIILRDGEAEMLSQLSFNARATRWPSNPLASWLRPNHPTRVANSRFKMASRWPADLLVINPVTGREKSSCSSEHCPPVILAISSQKHSPASRQPTFGSRPLLSQRSCTSAANWQKKPEASWAYVWTRDTFEIG
jgi:hypothetical protein